MLYEKVQLTSAGTADWSQKLSLPDGIRTVAFDGDLLTRLIFADGTKRHFSSKFIGRDDLDPDGNVVTGHGTIDFHEVGTSDHLHGTCDWFRVDGVDQGILAFTHGSGKWSGATGRFDVTFSEWSAIDQNESVNGPDAVRIMAMFDGEGSIETP